MRSSCYGSVSGLLTFTIPVYMAFILSFSFDIKLFLAAKQLTMTSFMDKTPLICKSVCLPYAHIRTTWNMAIYLECNIQLYYY